MALAQTYKYLWGSGVILVVSLLHFNLGLLSDYKICGNSGCESPISRVQAIRDYHGKDCRFLSFKQGDTFYVYHKLTGKTEDLWAGSIDKQFGYFPKDAVQEEDVQAATVQVVATQESDFFCMDDFGNFIDSSHLDSNDDENIPNHDDSQATQSPAYTDATNAESPSGSVPADSPVSAQEGDSTLTQDDESKNAVDAAAGTREEVQGGSAASAPWLRSSVTGWLGLSSEEEPGTHTLGEKKDEMKEIEAESSFASSVTGWLGFGGQGEVDNAVKNKEAERETDGFLASTMPGWLGFGEKERTDQSAEKEKEEEGDSDDGQQPAENFISRRMSLDLEGNNLLEEENKGEGMLGWLGNGLSDRLGFGLGNQESGHVAPTMREEEETSKQEEPPASWFDMGMQDILGFREEKPGKDESTESGFMEAKEDKTLEQTAGSENVNALTEEGKTKISPESTAEESSKNKSVQSEVDPLPGSTVPMTAATDSSKESISTEGASQEDISPQSKSDGNSPHVGSITSVENSLLQLVNQEEEEDVLHDNRKEIQILDGEGSAEMEKGDHQIPTSIEDLGSNTFQGFSTQFDHTIDEDGKREIEETAEIPYLTHDADRSVKIGVSSGNESGGNDEERDLPQKEIVDGKTDESAERVGGSTDTQPVMSSGTAEEDKILTLYSEETSADHSDFLSITDNTTETETHEEADVHPVEGSPLEVTSSHLTSQSTESVSGYVSAEEKTPTYTSDSTTQVKDDEDQNSVSPHMELTDAQMLTETENNAEEHLQPAQTETTKHEKEILMTETEEMEPEKTEEIKGEEEVNTLEKQQEVEEEKQVEVGEEEVNTLNKQQEVEDEKQVEVGEEEVNTLNKQQEVEEEKQVEVGEEEVNTLEKQQEVEEEKQVEVGEEEVNTLNKQQEVEEEKQVEVGEEEVNTLNKQQEVEEEKQVEVGEEEVNTLDKQQEVEEEKQVEVGEGEEILLEVEENKEEEKPEDIHMVRKEENQETMEGINAIKKQEEEETEDKETQGEEEKVKKEMEKKEEVGQFKEEETPDVEEEEKMGDQKKLELSHHFNAEVEHNIQSSPHHQKNTEREGQSERSPETFTQSDKRETGDPEIDEEEQEGDKRQEIEMGETQENEEDKRRDTEEQEEKMPKCSNKLCPQTHIDGVVKGRVTNDSETKLSSTDGEEMEAGVQIPATDTDEVADDKGVSHTVPLEGMERGGDRKHEEEQSRDEVGGDEGKEEQQSNVTENEEIISSNANSLPDATFLGDLKDLQRSALDKDDQQYPSGAQSSDLSYDNTQGDKTKPGDTESSSIGISPEIQTQQIHSDHETPTEDIDDVRASEDVPVTSRDSNGDTVSSEFRAEAGSEISVDDPVDSKPLISDMAVPHVPLHPVVSSLQSDDYNKVMSETESGKAIAFSQAAAAESSPSLESNAGETSRPPDSMTPEQHLDSDSTQSFHTDPYIAPSQQQPQPSPPPITSSSSPSPSHLSSLQIKTLSKDYKSLLVHMSLDETAVLLELFGRNKLQFLDYILGSPETVTEEHNNDMAILLDIERLLHYHREVLLAPSVKLADAPEEDQEKTRAILTLEKLQMLLGRVKGTFSTGQSGITNTNHQAASKDMQATGEEVPSMRGVSSTGLDSSTSGHERTGIFKEKDGQLNGGTKEQATEERKSPPSGEALTSGVMEQILDFVDWITSHIHAVREFIIWLSVQHAASVRLITDTLLEFKSGGDHCIKHKF